MPCCEWWRRTSNDIPSRSYDWCSRRTCRRWQRRRPECGQSASRCGELEVNECALLLDNKWRRPLQTNCWLEEGVILSQCRQDRQCTYNVTLRRFLVPLVAVEKQWVSLKLNVFVALGTQHAMRMCHIVNCGLTGSTIFFSTSSHKRHDFQKKLLNTKFVFWFSTQLFFLKHFSFYEGMSEMW